jgi:excisionase family DNA binding protein
MREALSAKEAARLLNIPTSTVFRLVRRGDLRGFRAGRHLRVRVEWVEEYIRDHEIRRSERQDEAI